MSGDVGSKAVEPSSVDQGCKNGEVVKAGGEVVKASNGTNGRKNGSEEDQEDSEGEQEEQKEHESEQEEQESDQEDEGEEGREGLQTWWGKEGSRLGLQHVQIEYSVSNYWQSFFLL